ncbi:MAG: M23 family metallopeptidase [Nitrospiraceae bacterium]|jgi:murein DD-endopeptidase MepM/ murein hydrolase activator NlpD|nr:M23 family metallopeptidase [Nitrospiraceae bacterium]
MAKMPRTVTITILPGPTEKSIQWTLPRWMFHLVIVGFVLFLFGIGAMIFFYVVEAKKFVFYRNLIIETQTQKMHLDDYRKKLEQLEAELSQVNLLDGQISKMTEGSNTGSSSRSSSTESSGIPDQESSSGDLRRSPSGGNATNLKNSEETSVSTGKKTSWSHLEIQEQWQMPLKGWVTSPFGSRKSLLGTGEEFHPGIDIAQKVGALVQAPSDAMVVQTGFASDYGRFVMLFHGQGLTSIYAHLGKIDVHEGEMIRRGHIIGTVGLSGMTNGPHLHFELRKFGRPIDPVVFLASEISD